MKFAYISLFFVLIVLFFLSGCISQTLVNDANTFTDANTIMINHFVFEPNEIVVKAGTEVQWIQNDNVTHIVVSQALFESKSLAKGDKFTFKFDVPGEYTYYCSIHTSMTGKIIVK